MNGFIRSLRKFELKLLKSWKRESYARPSFAKLSSTALEGTEIFQQFKLKDFYDYILKNKEHPDIHHYDLNQTENLHFTLLRNPHFFIDVYAWMDHTEIHAHNFTGCFQMLEGDFTQTQYEFSPERTDTNWATGNLKLKERIRMTKGQVLAIPEGELFIHQVYHFARPSVSLCVRTPDSRAPYFSYFYPGLRLSETSFKRPDILRIKALNQLCGLKENLPKKAIQELLTTLNPSALMYEYLSGLPSFRPSPTMKNFLDKEIERHIEKTIKIDLQSIRRKNLIHMTKLEMGRP
jgi:hypothetical protein